MLSILEMTVNLHPDVKKYAKNTTQLNKGISKDLADMVGGGSKVAHDYYKGLQRNLRRKVAKMQIDKFKMSRKNLGGPQLAV
jgi:hypothetical protein